MPHREGSFISWKVPGTESAEGSFGAGRAEVSVYESYQSYIRAW